MKVALVHDYIKEFGGAERVLKVLTEIYPDAPVYTAFAVKGSTAWKEFKDRKIVESSPAPVLKIGSLYSPLRFLTPWIWGGFDLSGYDLVITSCSWYITRGFKISPHTRVVAYCHTPPRWLYGYETSVGFTRYWPVKVYAAIVGHFLRLFDFKTAQVPDRGKNKSGKITAGVDLFIANSKEIQARIKKFYRRESALVYPPVDTKNIASTSFGHEGIGKNDKYFLIVSRLVGAKGIEEAISAFKNSDYKLKIVGEALGFSDTNRGIQNSKIKNVELSGRVGDTELYELYAGATGFIALARNEDFGMTVVEAMAAGCPVIAFNGGGFKETVIDGITGILINDTDEKSIKEAVRKLINTKWNKQKIRDHVRQFSKEKFKEKLPEIIGKLFKHNPT